MSTSINHSSDVKLALPFIWVETQLTFILALHQYANLLQNSWNSLVNLINLVM